jgi:hypothetical protein
MASRLTSQDKLALMLTSAGSMRNLAALVGVTHQKVGRWLREGQPGGVQHIPDDSATLAAINQAFAIHKTLAREQAKVDHIPFNESTPVYAERKPLRTGEIGDRVFVTNTRFIEPTLRQQFFYNAHDSRKFYFGSVRSVVNLRTYFKGVAKQEKAAGHFKRETVNEAANIIAKRWRGDEKRFHNRIIDMERPFPLYTQKVNLVFEPGSMRAVDAIERQLYSKHEPATGEPGTKAADQFLLQLTPADFVPYEKTPAAPPKRARKRVKRKSGK